MSAPEAVWEVFATSLADLSAHSVSDTVGAVDVMVGAWIHRFGQPRVQQHIAVCQLGAFGLAGRPRRIENHGRIVGMRRMRF